jgi:hypothetical protein
VKRTPAVAAVTVCPEIRPTLATGRFIATWRSVPRSTTRTSVAPTPPKQCLVMLQAATGRRTLCHSCALLLQLLRGR